MEKITLRLLCLLSLLATVTINAQIENNYAFSESLETYEPLVGANERVLSRFTVGNVILPFDFQYAGKEIGNMRFQNNGALTVGSVQPQPNDLADLGQQDGNGATSIIAPLWDNNIRAAQNNTTAKQKTLVEGIAPNRTYTVEWENVLWGDVEGSEVSFRVIFEETTNKISFLYGPNSATTNQTASIGFNTEFSSALSFLSVTPGATATISSTVSNNVISTSNYPGEGTRYTFEYIPPSCGIPSSLDIDENLLTPTTASVTWTNAQNEVQWDILVTNRDTQNTAIVNANSNPFNLEGLDQDTKYSIAIRSNCQSGELSEFSSQVFFKTPAVCPQPISLAATNITLDSAQFNWSPGDAETSWEVAVLEVGDPEPSSGTMVAVTNYQISNLTKDTDYVLYVRANCGLTDGFSLWSTRSFRTLATCDAPSGLTVDNVGCSSLELSWVENNSATSWEVLVEKLGTSESFTLNTSSNPYIVQDLTPSRTYRVSVKSICAADDTSRFSQRAFGRTLDDTEAPVASANDITVQLDVLGNVTIQASDIDNGSTDNCEIASISVAPNTFDCASVGTPQTVVLTVTDVSGKRDTAEATVTVEDTMAPTAIAQDLTVQLDASGTVSILASAIDNGSSDNCSVSTLTVSPNTFDCASVGTPQTVLLTVTDASGNTDTAQATVTVEDTVAPTAIAQDITVQLDASGTVSIVASAIDNGSSDNCSVSTLTVSPNTFDCASVGTPQTVLLTVTDASGNSDTAQATVTVEDTMAPTAIAQDITVQLDASGTVSIVASAIDNGSSDNCSVSTLTVSPNTFDCASVGTPQTVVLTVTDASGNTDTAQATVTVEDTVAPTAIAQDITVQLDASGTVSIVASAIDNGSSDNCSVNTLTVTPNTFDCASVGTPQTVVLTVTDASGNSDTAEATVTVEDTMAPTAIAQDLTVQLDASGTVSIVASAIDNGSSDNCSVSTLTVSPNTFDCASVGTPQTVLLTVTDASGNTDTAEATVTVEDTMAPTAIAQDITVQLDASGTVSIVASAIDNGSSDNCSVSTLTVSPNTFDCASVGTPQTVLLTVTDASGNTDTAQATVTVEDTVAPTAIAQDITVQLDASGTVSIVASAIDNGSSDNCSVSTLTVSPNTFDCASVGTPQTVLLTVTDASGNSDTAEATVTVEDTMAPTAIAQDITVQLDASGTVSIVASAIDNGSSDNCSVSTLTVSPNTFDCASVGTPQTVVLTVTDASGNTDTAEATVTVEDTVAPTAIAQDITVQLDASGTVSIVASAIDNGSSDNCSVNTLTVTPNTFDCASVGTPQTVVLTVTDASGNSDTAEATVTVEDTMAPTAIAQDLTVQLDASGTVSIVASAIDNGSSDNCSVSTLTVSPNTFDCASVGTPQTVLLTVTDASGNSDTAEATVTVEDTMAPTAIAQDITVQLDASGTVSIVASAIDNGSSDNCSVSTLTVSPNTFDCASVGTPQTVVLTVTDASGNTDTAQATVTVEDTVAPTAIAQDITVQLDASGTVSIVASAIDNGSSDNCSVSTLTVSPNTFDCASVGTPQTVVLTVTDASGNSDTAEATVTVEDTMAPTAIAQDITVQLDASGTVSIVASAIDNGSSDNCSVSTLTVSPNTFDCASVGTPQTVVLTVTDASGNTDTAQATVTVEDTVAPTAIAQDITVQLDASGTVSIVASAIDNGSSDNCSVSTLTVSPNTFDCASVGTPQTVLLTVTDASGNTDTAQATVTVEDTVAPTAIAQDITVQLDASGTVSILASAIDNGSTDNCSISTLTVSPNTFDCASVGTPQTVVLTVTDASGNTDTAQATVTVEDTVAPTANCVAPFTLDLDDSGTATITSADINDMSSDNCAIESVTIDVTTFTVDNVGDNIITLTITDLSGNISTCSTVVTISDPTLSTEEIVAPSFEFYPNPTIDFIYFSKEIQSLKIYDMSGKYVFSSSSVSKSFDVSRLPSGLYILEIKGTDSKTVLKKMIKR
ncbi:hypothetical protein DCS32_01835 [Dokdonia sp. Dokd-P16]|uniref:fibronectin type III domain-containing protein n=1 Tax=Dokdonia sp. Dokd-P16 TaxID=2173169 RepID=UPI000D543ED0|nr:fibronectin type III domain-containing protein [Dokdonia sp. Dokd-P16]AWH72946.1 hypothetical protein DCS32_01835 [Dokdonia sp. Dokd-P16]